MEFLANLTIFWLSQKIEIGLIFLTSILCKSVFNHIVSLMSSTISFVFTSIDDVATITCFFDVQEIDLLINLNTYDISDFLSLSLFFQSIPIYL